MKLLKSNVFWVVVIFLAAVLCLFFIFFANDDGGDTVCVYVKGELYKEIPISYDGEYLISTDYGENVIEVKDGKVRVKSADCKNQVCVETGWISEKRLPIICSPHKLTVEISGDSEYDVIV